MSIFEIDKFVKNKKFAFAWKRLKISVFMRGWGIFDFTKGDFPTDNFLSGNFPILQFLKGYVRISETPQAAMVESAAIDGLGGRLLRP